MRPLSIGVDKAREKIKHYCAYQERTHQEVRNKLFSFGINIAEMEQLIAEMDNALDEIPGVEAIPNVKISLQERGIVISLSNTLFFQAGSAQIKPEAIKILDKLAKSINDSERMIHIEGHTDSSPIATAIFPSNWELSSARASSVVRYLNSKHHIPSHRLAAIGYGQSRPAANNFAPQGRQLNRRVDIVLLSNAAAEVAGESPNGDTAKKTTGPAKPSESQKVVPKKDHHAQFTPPDLKPNMGSTQPQRIIRVSLESKSPATSQGSIVPDLRPTSPKVPTSTSRPIKAQSPIRSHIKP